MDLKFLFATLFALLATVMAQAASDSNES
uniref:Uncharacterized protein n=1 Tax=Anopheles funestus TaxID=62324 RepID=A0A4Y0BEQ3_ANOFN